ncbi:DUF3631 domain-containing protein [Brachybacterium alimentarium]|uniref:DUF3631 domain-containing protein n=1 Tax=Brachybacterium alimentarium TaxID=47845 RepID=UPI000DF1D9ED|nr:DUF3631 domain-containing protein [Brachybacterium alimentarium]RCS67670.1 DUF3631 domain-containing protein [Brachybacterium alimentarium]
MSRPGHEILDDIEQAFRRFTIQQAEQDYEALALWTLYTHAAASFDYAPRLVLTSAEKRSGKSRTMEIAAAVAYAPMMTASVTPAALYRSIPDDGDTLTVFVDEADTIYGKNASSETAEALRGFINAGFRRGAPTIRVEGPNHTPTTFFTFSPVCIAAIGRLPDTVTDRAVNIRLRRRKNTETVDPYRIRLHEPALKDIAESASEWARENKEFLASHIPSDMPVDDRAADLWEPLVAVADVAGGSWPDRARDAARHHTGLEGDDEDESAGIEMLRDIREVLELHHGDRISSRSLTDLLRGKEESRWAEEDLKARRLTITLREFGLRTVRMPGGAANGFFISKFEDAFDRYLSPPTALPPPTEAQQVHKTHFSGLTSVNVNVSPEERVSTQVHTPTEVHDYNTRSEPESVPSVPSDGSVPGAGEGALELDDTEPHSGRVIAIDHSPVRGLRAQVLAAVEEAQGEVTPPDVLDAVPELSTFKIAGTTLGQLATAGLIRKTGRGKYAALTTQEGTA